jgi:hypothetical protein
MWAAARAIAEHGAYDEALWGEPAPAASGVVVQLGPEPEAEPQAQPAPLVEPEPKPEPKAKPKLKVVRPEPEPAAPDPDMPVFTEELIAKMFANLAAHGMTLQDLAG